jgi:hypothetical protein
MPVAQLVTPIVEWLTSLTVQLVISQRQNGSGMLHLSSSNGDMHTFHTRIQRVSEDTWNWQANAIE